MERAIPQKVSFDPSCETETAMPTGQKQVPSGVNRRGRTSVAMIGLAISMGAHSLLLPQANDSAIAAEPIPGEPASTVNVAAASHATGSAPTTAKSAVIEHTVQEGQTLQQLARFYGVDAIVVASANNLPLESVLHVGQVLKIPTSSLVARVPQAGNASPEYYGLVSGEPPAPPLASSNADAVLKTQQDEAVVRLAQKREGLRASLSQMRLDKREVTPVAAELPKAAEQASATSAVAESAKLTLTASEPTPPALVQPTPASSNLASSPVLSQTVQATPAKGTVVVALATSPNSGSYQVNAGDTLSAIARSYSISEEQLAAANKITNPNLIRANQVLKIPNRSGDVPIASIQSSGSVQPKASTIAADVPVVGAPSANRGAPDAASLIEARLRQIGSPATRPMSTLPLADTPTVPQSDRVATTFTGAGAGQSRSEDLIVPTTNYSHVENLKIELLKLREKYSTAGSQAVIKAASISPAPDPDKTRSEPVNPEFNPKASELKTSEQSVQISERLQAQDTTPTVKPQPQKVATASLGSQSYSSLTSSMVGQMVSPSLPPLGSAEAYLPGKSGKFAGYIWPAQGMLSSGYGWRWGRMHKGIDIAAPVGTPVVAAAGGKVSYADWNSGGYGNLVEITHPDGSVTLYAHNNRILVREGQEVSQGEQIAEMGSTGYSTGPHSHFEVHLPGQGAVNPIGYLPGNGVS